MLSGGGRRRRRARSDAVLRETRRSCPSRPRRPKTSMLLAACASRAHWRGCAFRSREDMLLLHARQTMERFACFDGLLVGQADLDDMRARMRQQEARLLADEAEVARLEQNFAQLTAERACRRAQCSARIFSGLRLRCALVAARAREGSRRGQALGSQQHRPQNGGGRQGQCGRQGGIHLKSTIWDLGAHVVCVHRQPEVSRIYCTVLGRKHLAVLLQGTRRGYTYLGERSESRGEISPYRTKYIP